MSGIRVVIVLVSQPETSAAFLLLGLVPGGGERFVITEALSLGMALMGPQSRATVIPRK